MADVSILVTNDDGIHSQGLRRLATALAPLGAVTVVAPDREKSAASHALTLHRPVQLRQIERGVFTTDGTPADCVYLGALEVLPRKPDLVASGINRGGNIGDDVTYSGTIAAALEGTILGMPSFAISQLGRHDFDFTTAGHVAREVAERILAEGLPTDTLLNVNVPEGTVAGLRCTRQGKHVYEQVVHEARSPRGNVCYWIGAGAPQRLDQPDDTDATAVAQGYVSVTPLHLDLTHRGALQTLVSTWESPLNRRLAESAPRFGSHPEES